MPNRELLFYLTLGIFLVACICCCLNQYSNEKDESCQNSQNSYEKIEKKCFCKLLDDRDIFTGKNDKHHTNETNEGTKHSSSPNEGKNISRNTQETQKEPLSNSIKSPKDLQSSQEAPKEPLMGSHRDLKELPKNYLATPDELQKLIDPSPDPLQQTELPISSDGSPKDLRRSKESFNELLMGSHGDLEEPKKSYGGTPDELKKLLSPPDPPQQRELPISSDESPKDLRRSKESLNELLMGSHGDLEEPKKSYEGTPDELKKLLSPTPDPPQP